MATNRGDFPLPKDGYLTFDSAGMKAHLKQRLTDNGIFSDQLYEGSNISQIIDILSFTFNGLIYYLNRTSTETTFKDTQIYENINRIVQEIGYNPIGRQTSVLSFTCSAESAMAPALYTIPRYSYVNLGALSFSFNEDITFYKSLSGQAEFLSDFSMSKLFYQGRFIEYTPYTATGEENEIIYLLPGSNILIDHFNIHVYVKSSVDNGWSQMERTPSLYLATANEAKFEIRLNENKNYEIKFGNNINGKKLNVGDTVAIYYLKSNGTEGEVGANVLPAGKLIKYNTSQFSEIFNDVIIENLTIIPETELINLVFDNNSSSTYYSEEEDVESIRQNAPNLFRSQYRLVTESDFENYVKTNYANLIHDIKVVNNWSYLSNYLKYYYDIGITNPNNVSRVLYNQVNFADSCNFANIYLFIVPKIVTSSTNQISYLNPALKTLIISSMKDVKMTGSEPIVFDPMYMAFDVALSKIGLTPKTDDANNSEILIIKKDNSRRDSSAIQTDVVNVFTNYFTRTNCTLGQTIGIDFLNNAILAIEGVHKFYTRRTDDTSVKYEGLSLVSWNPIYLNDIKFITQNLVLSFFMFPYFNNLENLKTKITVQTNNTIFESIEH